MKWRGLLSRILEFVTRIIPESPMKFNLALLQAVLILFANLVVFIWTRCSRRILRWIQEQLRRRLGPWTLKPNSHLVCPLCKQDICLLPHRPRPEVEP